MSAPATILGIDVGATAVALVEIDHAGAELHASYLVHHGRVREALEQLLAEVYLSEVGAVGCTASAAPWLRDVPAYDNQVAHIAAVHHRHGRVGAVLIVGGEKFGLVRFDERGEYREARANTSCAAGTGSFLDQQAEGLGLESSAALAALAEASVGESPKIASRCAVFAKTDLIHAQQQGFSREAICDGLCAGLAAIIADTLFAGEPVAGPIAFSGGVALNPAVRRHLASRIGVELRVDGGPQCHGALGAALLLREELGGLRRPRRAARRPQAAERWGTADAPAPSRPAVPSSRSGLLAEPEPPGGTFYPPLELRLSSYPDFSAHRHFELTPEMAAATGPVEVDVYLDTPDRGHGPLYLGIDIGSTSTKAALVDGERRVAAGFYTRTSGRPLDAVQGLFEAIVRSASHQGLELDIRAAATTGAGRKLIATLVGADLVIDEITAHARAATELCPDVDTIIEIGGQDSKFTTLRHGRVTSAVMNTVCAAGTGSFIEEQARRLRCPLESYAATVAGARAPLASDRCTVFMQRDVHQLISAGYSVPEVLGAVLHAVRENYLRRVAREGSIGERVCFQGATAKNRALVAAFEQKLGQPILVSRYCHLTGAVGAALLAAEHGVGATAFRGLELYRARIELGHEHCELCRNHCRLTTAEVGGERVAYGYLCGRDTGTERFVSRNRSGFDLGRARRRALGGPPTVAARPRTARPGAVRIGIPAALQLQEQLPLWRRFFEELGVRVVTSEGCEAPVSRGKRWARAEFCAPIAAFHGHIEYLADRADYLFTPVLLEASTPSRQHRRQYCYYSQYSSALVPTIAIAGLRARCLSPLLPKPGAQPSIPLRLRDALRPALGADLSLARVTEAYARALGHAEQVKAELRATMTRELGSRNDIAVVLLGRPYACLAPQLNKGIPDIIASLGVKTFYQDMLSYSAADVEPVAELGRAVHWHYAATILEAAEVVGKIPGLYPVLVTCFKCTPDSCTLDYAKRILDSHDKPYLVLELDEHDSALGYETRIEAAVRAFRNHHAAARPRVLAPPRPRAARALQRSELRDRALFVPTWDPLASELIVANLNRWGVRSERLIDDAHIIQKSLRLNTGQCIPLTIMAQSFIDAVERRGLDPAEAAVWVPDSSMACNLGMYPAVLGSLFEAHGHGFERARIYAGGIAMVDLTPVGALDNYLAHMTGGYLRRMACHLRPYERVAGTTDQVQGEALELLRQAFLGERPKLATVEQVVDRFLGIELVPATRPKVAIFGDLYTRDNDVANQELGHFIEAYGGEVITTPYSEFCKIIASSYFRKWLREGDVAEAAASSSLLGVARTLEQPFLRQFERVLGRRPRLPAPRPVDEQLAPFVISSRHTGESADNLLKILQVLREHPDVSLFVQANPAYCCPALVTEAMSRRIEEVTGVPVVTLTYDGTACSKNEAVIPYLTWPRLQRSAAHSRR